MNFTGRAQGLYQPPYNSGRYYNPDGMIFTAAGAAVATGTIYLTPGIIRRAVTISALIARLTTLAAGGNVQISLYASDAQTGYPTGAPLFTSASQSTAAATVIEVAIARTLSPGLYWFGLQCDNATAVFTTPHNGAIALTAALGVSTTNNILQPGNSNIIGLQKAGVFGTWPAWTGNRAADALIENTGSYAWGFKVA